MRGGVMNYCECGGVYHKKKDELLLYDGSIGPYSVVDVSYEQCSKCGELMFPPETLRIIEETRNRKREEFIRNEPVGNFISAAETAAILGISRQALHKHRRIRRGFIYSTTIGDIKVYHRKSVELFKSDGDGRFLLCLDAVNRGQYGDELRSEVKRDFGRTAKSMGTPFEKSKTIKVQRGKTYAGR